MLTRTKKGKIDYRSPLIHSHETNEETLRIMAEVSRKIISKDLEILESYITYSDGTTTTQLFDKGRAWKNLTVIFGKGEHNEYISYVNTLTRRYYIDEVLLDLENNPV